jgi:hypothetical protein
MQGDTFNAGRGPFNGGIVGQAHRLPLLLVEHVVPKRINKYLRFRHLMNIVFGEEDPPTWQVGACPKSENRG